jgi:hypothetical protein
MSFDLKKYLANNPLLNEGLSNKEQMVVNDILSVTEGPKDVYNKLVSYGKKGMMSLAIIASVLTGCAKQGDMDSAEAAIEYAVNNNWAGSDDQKFALTALSYVDSADAKELAPGEFNPDGENDPDGGFQADMDAQASGPGSPDYEARKRDVLYTLTSNYLFDILLNDLSPEEAQSKIKGIGTTLSKEDVLDYISQIENTLSSDSTLAKKLFRAELMGGLEAAKSGEMNPKWAKLFK